VDAPSRDGGFVPEGGVCSAQSCAGACCGSLCIPTDCAGCSAAPFFCPFSLAVANSNGICLPDCSTCNPGDAGALNVACTTCRGGSVTSQCTADPGQCPADLPGGGCSCDLDDGGACPSATEVCVSSSGSTGVCLTCGQSGTVGGSCENGNICASPDPGSAAAGTCAPTR
jgi:hypothetical protein